MWTSFGCWVRQAKVLVDAITRKSRVSPIIRIDGKTWYYYLANNKYFLAEPSLKLIESPIRIPAKIIQDLERISYVICIAHSMGPHEVQAELATVIFFRTHQIRQPLVACDLDSKHRHLQAPTFKSSLLELGANPDTQLHQWIARLVTPDEFDVDEHGDEP